MTEMASRLGANKSIINREIQFHIFIKAVFPIKNCSHRNQVVLCNLCQFRGHCAKECHYYNYVEALKNVGLQNRSARCKSKLSPKQIHFNNDIVSKIIHPYALNNDGTKYHPRNFHHL